MDFAYLALSNLGFNADHLAPWLAWSALGLIGLLLAGLGYALLLGGVVGCRLLLEQWTRITRRRAAALIAAEDHQRGLAEARARRTRAETEAAEAQHVLQERCEAASRDRKKLQADNADLRARIKALETAASETEKALTALRQDLKVRDDKLLLADQRSQELLLEIDEVQKAEAKAKQGLREATLVIAELRARLDSVDQVTSRLDELRDAVHALTPLSVA